METCSDLDVDQEVEGAFAIWETCDVLRKCEWLD